MSYCGHSWYAASLAMEFCHALWYILLLVVSDLGISMAMEMDKIELMVELQVFTHIHDQRAVHRQFIPDTQ